MNTVTTNSKMTANTYYDSLNNLELLKAQETINSLIEKRRKEVLDSIKAFGITPEEIASYLGVETKPIITVQKEETAICEETVSGDSKDNDPIIPENKEDQKEVKTGSVFDTPALKAPYTPIAVKEKAPAASEERLIPMEEYLSKYPEYKEYYYGKPSIKEDKRKVVPFDELRSGKPINKILNMGNDQDKDADYRQHTRHAHVSGIIPTEMATGKTGIYIG